MEQNQQPQALPYPVPPKEPPTPAPPRIALYAALLALVCSAAAYPTIVSFFQFDTLWGINVPLCAALVYGVYALAMRGQRAIEWKRGGPLFALIAPLAVAPALFSVPELIALDVMVLFPLMMLHLSLLSGGNWHKLQGTSRIEQLIIDLLGRPLVYIPDGCKTTMSGSSGKGALRNVLLAAAGAAIAAPVLLIVVALLASADADFSGVLESLTKHMDIPQVIAILFFALIALFPMLSMLYSLPLGKSLTRPQAESAPGKGIHPIPIYTALVLFDVVLLLFAVVRVRSFLGEALVLPRHYADQAHEDFFPMLAAALICFGVQWFCLRFARKEGRALPLRILVTAMSGGLLVMMASAMRSILLYQGAFGLTRLRVYVTVGIAVLFVLLSLTLLRVWLKKFPYHTLAALVLCAALIGVNYCNVDRMIATNNLAMHETLSGGVDYPYLLSLSADALDVLADHPPEAYEKDAAEKEEWNRCDSEDLIRVLHENEREYQGLRTWNYGRARAQAKYIAMPGYLIPIEKW